MCVCVCVCVCVLFVYEKVIGTIFKSILRAHLFAYS